jgi:dihydrofolate reductase
MSFAPLGGLQQRPETNALRNQRLKEDPMRKIVAAYFISLDGVVESPDKWHFPYFNEEMGEAIGSAMADADAMLLGRVNYEEWAAYWPTHTGDDQEFAEYINNVPKYVVSTTLTKADWSNSTLISEDVAAEITKLKQQPGKNISMSGSGTLAAWLLQNDLVDELRLLVHPIVVGSGKRLFPDGTPQKPLELVGSKTFSTGVLDLTYRPAAK